MTTDIAIYERALEPMLPAYQDLLKPIGMPAERLVRTVLVTIERTPAVAECSMQSIVNCATTAAVLGLEVDGVTGQAFLIPFDVKGRGKTAQLIIGYKGFNTLAYRAGYTVTGGIIREGDDYDFELGTGGHLRHKPKLGAGLDRPIIAAYAIAQHRELPPIISLVERDELLAVKARSPGARRSSSPWNDPAVGFPAMCEKTAKRRLARSMPLNMMQLAASIDEAAEERGLPAWVTQDGKAVIDGTSGAVLSPERTEAKPKFAVEDLKILMLDGTERIFPNVKAWREYWFRIVQELEIKKPEAIAEYHRVNNDQLAKIREAYPADVDQVEGRLA